MLQFFKKAGSVLRTVFGYGILICLLAGGLSVLGFIAALVIGGETATAICLFLKDVYLKWVVYGSSVMILLGLLAMYLTQEKALSIKEEKKRK